jgi:hypothetical protein
MRALSFFLPVAIASLPVIASAAEFDGAKPFLCTTIDVSSCVPGQDCARESAQTVNAPQFFVVDVGKKLVGETGTGNNGRTSKIDQVQHQSGLLLLSGTDGSQGWTASIGESNGKMTYVVIGDRVAIVAFGACLNQP